MDEFADDNAIDITICVPTRFGSMGAPIKNFFDQTRALWMHEFKKMLRGKRRI